MSEDNSKYIVVGKIGATYGIAGWLKIHTYTEFGENILHYAPWYLSVADQQSYDEITIETGKPHGNSFIAKLHGIDTPEAARLYTGKTISIKRSQLPDLKQGEYYWSDLVGLTVINTRGEALGTVSYLIETGANDVLVIKGDKEHAIPYLPGSVVLSVDLAKKEIIVDWELI
jgi:16S rRNA processing protein RimM